MQKHKQDIIIGHIEGLLLEGYNEIQKRRLPADEELDKLIEFNHRFRKLITSM